MKANALFLLVFMLFVSCGSGKSTPPTDEDSGTTNDDIATDSDAVSDTDNELSDAESDGDGDEIADEDVAPTIIINCPESVDETEASVTCTITSTSESIALVEDSCGGTLHRNDMTYEFNLYEALGPAVCTVSIKNNETDEIAEATVNINEVNETPRIQAEIEMFFYEGVVKKKSIIVPDSDLPNDTSGDPGFLTCSLKDNTCGDWVSVAKIDYRTCEISGMMPEALTDGNCSFTFVVEDGYGAKTEQAVTTELREKNDAPVWMTDTAPISLLAGTPYNEINGVATESDLPNVADGDPGFVTCVLDLNSCSFDVSVTTERAAEVASCRVSFTAGDVTENCRLYYHITDGNTNVAMPVPVTIAVTASVSINCPESVNEGEEIVCDVTAIGGDPGAQAWSVNTCHGTVVKEGDDWKYRYTTTEADGPKICDAAVAIGTLLASDSVEIKEVNQLPTLWFTNSSGATVAPATFEATEGVNIFINAKFTDSDMPQIATTDPGYVSCEVKSNSCGSWLLFNAANCMGSGIPDETAGGTECSYAVEVADGYGATISATVTIAIAEVNTPPRVADIDTIHLKTYEQRSFTVTVTDSDLPNSAPGDPGYITCKTLWQHDPGIPILSSAFVTGEGGGSVECDVTLIAEESVHIYGQGDGFALIAEDGFGSLSNTAPGVVIRLKKCHYYVTEDASGTGLGWDDALSLQDAVDESWAGCEIWVKRGTYTPSSDDGTSVLTMKDGVKISGGYEGYEAYDNDTEFGRTRAEPLVHSVFDGENTSDHVVVGAAENALLDGFIIKNGDASSHGGGLFASGDNSNLLIKNTVFEDNFAGLGGGAIYSTGISLRCERTTFINNQTNAVYISGGSAIFMQSSFFANGDQFTGRDGGAIYIRGNEDTDSLTVINSLFAHNRGLNFGGAIDFGDIATDISFSTFVDNRDRYGLAFSYGAATERAFSNCIFWNNGVEDSDIVSYSYAEGATEGVGNISSMPPTATMFIDEASDDFHLDPTSPAIDAADPDATLADDLDGNDRPQGTARDMGAYEYEE